MKKHFLLAISSLISFNSVSQTIQNGKVNTESTKIVGKLDTSKKQEGWTVRGTNVLLLNQAAFSNWVAGGSNSIALTARTDYEFNLKKEKACGKTGFYLVMDLGLKKIENQQKLKM